MEADQYHEKKATRCANVRQDIIRIIGGPQPLCGVVSNDYMASIIIYVGGVSVIS